MVTRYSLPSSLTLRSDRRRAAQSELAHAGEASRYFLTSTPVSESLLDVDAAQAQHVVGAGDEVPAAPSLDLLCLHPIARAHGRTSPRDSGAPHPLSAASGDARTRRTSEEVMEGSWAVCAVGLPLVWKWRMRCCCALVSSGMRSMV